MHGQTESGCQTTDTAFYVYGIPHGQRLRTGTRLRFTDADRGFDPSLSFFERLARAFRGAFAAAASGPVVPEPVDAAVEDAREATAHEFVDRPDADFEAVLAAFYERVARYTCVYRELADENRDGPDHHQR